MLSRTDPARHPLRSMGGIAEGEMVRGIPFRDALRYARSMTIQIAVRLPNEMVEFLDRAVADGLVPSRAALVASALEREMRRRIAEMDAERLRSAGAADDLDALVDWTAAHPVVDGL